MNSQIKMFSKEFDSYEQQRRLLEGSIKTMRNVFKDIMEFLDHVIGILVYAGCEAKLYETDKSSAYKQKLQVKIERFLINNIKKAFAQDATEKDRLNAFENFVSESREKLKEKLTKYETTKENFLAMHNQLEENAKSVEEETKTLADTIRKNLPANTRASTAEWKSSVTDILKHTEVLQSLQKELIGFKKTTMNDGDVNHLRASLSHFNIHELVATSGELQTVGKREDFVFDDQYAAVEKLLNFIKDTRMHSSPDSVEILLSAVNILEAVVQRLLANLALQYHDRCIKKVKGFRRRRELEEWKATNFTSALKPCLKAMGDDIPVIKAVRLLTTDIRDSGICELVERAEDFLENIDSEDNSARIGKTKPYLAELGTKAVSMLKQVETVNTEFVESMDQYVQHDEVNMVQWTARHKTCIEQVKQLLEEYEVAKNPKKPSSISAMEKVIESDFTTMLASSLVNDAKKKVKEIKHEIDKARTVFQEKELTLTQLPLALAESPTRAAMVYVTELELLLEQRKRLQGARVAVYECKDIKNNDKNLKAPIYLCEKHASLGSEKSRINSKIVYHCDIAGCRPQAGELLETVNAVKNGQKNKAQKDQASKKNCNEKGPTKNGRELLNKFQKTNLSTDTTTQQDRKAQDMATKIIKTSEQKVEQSTKEKVAKGEAAIKEWKRKEEENANEAQKMHLRGVPQEKQEAAPPPAVIDYKPAPPMAPAKIEFALEEAEKEAKLTAQKEKEEQEKRIKLALEAKKKAVERERKKKEEEKQARLAEVARQGREEGEKLKAEIEKKAKARELPGSETANKTALATAALKEKKQYIQPAIDTRNVAKQMQEEVGTSINECDKDIEETMKKLQTQMARKQQLEAKNKKLGEIVQEQTEVIERQRPAMEMLENMGAREGASLPPPPQTIATPPPVVGIANYTAVGIANNTAATPPTLSAQEVQAMQQQMMMMAALLQANGISMPLPGVP
eukprot:m.108135 g.108135  ORF g.108135 m.108135 type:complete len:969 (+) comp13950_c0_seq1:1727-4633(+)